MIKVLVTGAGALLGQGVLRAVRMSSLETTVVAVDPSPLSVGLYWADQSYLVPMASDPRYLDAFRKVLKKERPDVVMVGTDVELRLLAEHRAELEQEFSTHVLVSSPRVVEIADDKYLTATFLREHGFPYPLSALPGDHAHVVEKAGFPLIVKPRRGARSIGVRTVNNADELRQTLTGATGDVIQECVGSADGEYTAGVVAFPGQPLVSIVMRRDLRDGNTYRAFVEDYPEFNEMSRKVAAALDVYGPVNFQFRLDNGVPKIFEINARYSGTTPLRARAGFNEVEMALRHLVLGEPIVAPDVKKVTFLRHWDDLMVESSQLLRGADNVFDARANS